LGEEDALAAKDTLYPVWIYYWNTSRHCRAFEPTLAGSLGVKFEVLLYDQPALF